MEDVKRRLDPYCRPRIGIWIVCALAAASAAVAIVRGGDDLLWELGWMFLCLTAFVTALVQLGKLSKPNSLELADPARGTDAMVIAYDSAVAIGFLMAAGMVLF